MSTYDWFRNDRGNYVRKLDDSYVTVFFREDSWQFVYSGDFDDQKFDNLTDAISAAEGVYFCE